MSNTAEPASTPIVELLTSEEVASMLRLTDHYVRRMRALGTGPAFIKLPTGGVRYRTEDVLAWINSTSVSNG